MYMHLKFIREAFMTLWFLEKGITDAHLYLALNLNPYLY